MMRQCVPLCKTSLLKVSLNPRVTSSAVGKAHDLASPWESGSKTLVPRGDSAHTMRGLIRGREMTRQPRSGLGGVFARADSPAVAAVCTRVWQGRGGSRPPRPVLLHRGPSIGLAPRIPPEPRCGRSTRQELEDGLMQMPCPPDKPRCSLPPLSRNSRDVAVFTTRHIKVRL